MNRYTTDNTERGVSTLEFTFVAGAFLMMIVAIVSGSHLFFTHNALVESTRRGARYAANQCKPNDADCPNSDTSLERIKYVVLYGTPTAGTAPLVNNLTPANITVEYSVNTAPVDQPPNDFGVGRGTVSVKIENYGYMFALLSTPIPMPAYQTTAAGENAGFVPPDKP
jgi:Flp pilus assembly protein TadG